MRQPYRTDLTDEQWKLIKPLIPCAKPGGRPRAVDMRAALNTLLYQARTGCRWDMLPHDLLKKGTVYDYFAQWRGGGDWERDGGAPRRRPGERQGGPPDPARGQHRNQKGKAHGDRG